MSSRCLTLGDDPNPLFPALDFTCTESVQATGLLSEALEIGSNFCMRVVDIGVQAANNAVFSSLIAAESLGLDPAGSLQTHLVIAADTACNAAYRGIQLLMQEEQMSLNSTSTIDLGAAATDHPDGRSLTCVTHRCMVSPPAFELLTSIDAFRRSAHHFKETLSWIFRTRQCYY